MGRNFSSANARPDISAVCSAQRQHGARWEACVYHFPLLEAAQTVTCLSPSHNISIGTKNDPTPIIWHSSDNEVATNPFSNFHLYKSLSADWGVEHSSSSSTEKKRMRGKGCVLQRLFKLTHFERSQNTTAWTCNTS